jgi:hypothetical protein
MTSKSDLEQLASHAKMSKSVVARLHRQMPAASEHSIQAAFHHFIRLSYPNVPAFSVPNGSHLAGTPKQRSAKMARLKAEGLTPGAPDYIIDCARGVFHGLRIEFKRPGRSTLDQEQRVMSRKYDAHGYRYVLCNDVDEAIALVRSYMGSA